MLAGTGQPIEIDADDQENQWTVGKGLIATMIRLTGTRGFCTQQETSEMAGLECLLPGTVTDCRLPLQRRGPKSVRSLAVNNVGIRITRNR